MEMQTALAVPDEDNSIVVYTSCQTPETAHNVIATCLGIPCNRVRVITRRVGGGFGGKAVRALPVSIRNNSCLLLQITHIVSGEANTIQEHLIPRIHRPN
jgi:CO/xanthine dehydrogenase Mo-binding subunit